MSDLRLSLLLLGLRPAHSDSEQDATRWIRSVPTNVYSESAHSPMDMGEYGTLLEELLDNLKVARSGGDM